MPSVFFPAEEVSIIVSSADTNIRNENDTLLVVCVGVGYPEHSIYWSRDGDPIENGSRVKIYEESSTLAGRFSLQSILEVCNVSVMDGRLYECTATNRLLNTTSNSTMTVGGKINYLLICLSSAPQADLRL